MKLLVIEDNLDHQKILEKILEKDFEIDFVSSASAGLEKQAETRFGLILVDFNLGDMTGIDFIRLARENRNKCPIVLMSSKVSLQMRMEAREAGGTFCVEKQQIFGQKDRLLRLIQNLIEENRRENSRIKRMFGPYLQVFENYLRPMILLDSSGKILLVNQKFRKILHASPEELIYNKFPRFVEKSFRPDLFVFMKRVLVEGEANHFSTKLKNARNQDVEVSFRGRTVFLEAESPWILLEAKLEPERNSHGKENSWHDFLHWLRETGRGLAVIDSGEQIVFWNNEASRAFRLPHFRGQTLPMDHLLEMDSIREFRRLVLEENPMHPAGKKIEFEGRNSEGKKIRLQCYFVGESGASERFLIVRSAHAEEKLFQNAFREKEYLKI